MNNRELWQGVLAQIQFNISKANFATWFRKTKILSKKDGRAIISVPNLFSKEWLSNKYHYLILKILRSLDREIKTVEYVVEAEKDYSRETKQILKKNLDLVPQLQFPEFKIDQQTNLNPHYTFNNFIVGSFNETAQAAAWAVSKKLGAYNPLFIYGGVGLGKTHLLQASGNQIVKSYASKKIKYLTSERLISSIVSAIRNQEIENFKAELRKLDVLIIDDVQFFSGKEKTQEEFFHVFNSLHDQQKQIILSSDRPPKAIPNLEERLRSRFGGGMIVDIGLPDFETRLAILKAKSEEQQVAIPTDVLEYVASNIQKSIRELEGALNRLIIFTEINNSLPDLKTAKKLLRDFIFSPKKATNFKKIIKTVANFYSLEEKEILTNTRRKEVVRPRQVAMYLLRNELNESFPSIGRRFGGKDHTTAMYACHKITKLTNEDDNFLHEINLIRQRIYSELPGDFFGNK